MLKDICFAVARRIPQSQFSDTIPLSSSSSLYYLSFSKKKKKKKEKKEVDEQFKNNKRSTKVNETLC